LRRTRESVVLAAVACVAAAAWLSGGLRAPWSGLAAALAGAALLALGARATLRWALAAAAAAASVAAGIILAADGGGADAEGVCDPSCGISSAGALAVAAAVAMAVTGIGWGVAAAWRRGARR
jgi:hypothetical protein